MYMGSKWYKCDFHIHTYHSLCFKDENNCPEAFFKRINELGIECIAITDHNTAAGVDEFVEIGKRFNVTVFPGVEITCSDSKIHLLSIFDLDVKQIYIEDFLRDIGISRSDFGTKEAHSNKSISEIAEKVSELGGLVIPSHIDDYSGVAHVCSSVRNSFFKRDDINAVQMVKRELIEVDKRDLDSRSFKDALIEKYNDINELNVSAYISCTKDIIDMNLGIMTFSDNPLHEGSSKHGLWGIGKSYTWIKMDSKPSLEGLRQAMLMPNERIRNGIQYQDAPYTEPPLYIKSFKVRDIETIENDIELEFSTQLNTIIGGRGSGKSTIIKLLTGIFSKSKIKDLNEIYREFNLFFKIKENSKDEYGVLKNTTIIEVELIKNTFIYKIIVSNFTSKGYDIKVEKLSENGVEVIEDIDVEDIFKVDIYNQKQIYEMSKNPNVLLEYIDSLIPEIEIIKKDIFENKMKFISLTLEKLDKEVKLRERKKIEIEIKDINEKIDLFNKTGIKDILDEHRDFVNEAGVLNSFYKDIEKKVDFINESLKDSNIVCPEINTIRNEFQSELNEFMQINKLKYNNIIEKIKKSITELESVKINFRESIASTEWNIKRKSIGEKYNKSIEELKNKNINTIDIEMLMKKLEEKNLDLKKLDSIPSEIEECKDQLRCIKEEYFNFYIKLRNERNRFVKELLKATNIKMEFKNSRNRVDFEKQLRSILQKKDRYDSEFDEIVKNIYDSGNVSENIVKLIEDFNNIILGKETFWTYKGKFINLIKDLNQEQLATLELLVPEDEIKISYKPNGSNEYKPLSNASAGQRTSVILTIILSDGNTPLILDQPEDDLDNKLIFDLIVERLKDSKEKRQIITVTHNPNIPVNGDSELIVSMNSLSKYVEVGTIGSLGDIMVKKEICDIMEGGKLAFEMRAKKYNLSE
ncbi:MAG: TrlF family AAA-like ATPase [Paraclostridium sordellii]